MDNNFAGLSLGVIKGYAQQILNSLKVLKRHSIIHCDLKPENILLKDSEGQSIKLIDFGSSCFLREKVYTYIQSRFYRAPEIILGISYTTAIDMWSLGCILAELHTGFPLFPGESETEQLALIMEVNGLPPVDLLKKATRSKLFFASDERPLPISGGKEPLKEPGSKSLKGILKCNDSLFIDFLSKCFTWEPDKRITPEEALKHPWILSEEEKGVERKEQTVLSKFKETLRQLSIKQNIRCETERNTNNTFLPISIPIKQKKISLVSNRSKYKA